MTPRPARTRGRNAGIAAIIRSTRPTVRCGDTPPALFEQISETDYRCTRCGVINTCEADSFPSFGGTTEWWERCTCLRYPCHRLQPHRSALNKRRPQRESAVPFPPVLGEEKSLRASLLEDARQLANAHPTGNALRAKEKATDDRPSQ